MSRAKVPYKILGQVNDKSYIVELPGDYGVHTTFRIEENSFERGRNDADVNCNPSEVLKSGCECKTLKTRCDCEGRRTHLRVAANG